MTSFFKKLDDRAVTPMQKRSSDTGWDVTLIDRVEGSYRDLDHGFVETYRTGLIVAPPEGYYFDLAPRSSLSKYGCVMPNSFGVIDSTYRGELLVPIIHFEDSLELPGRYVQLILRPLIPTVFKEVSEFEGTDRGTQGFGSSGK